MKTIVDGKSDIIKILGEQRVKDTEYRLMNYVLSTQCDDGVLMHNSITGKLILLSEEEAQFIHLLPAMRTEAITELIKSYFLVPVDYDEKNTVQKLRKILKRLDTQKDFESYTILTTTNCNARCFYCYESDLPHLNMDEATAEKLVDFMIKHRGRKILKLHWFGGEPLVCMNRIDQITQALRDRNIKYVSSMTSNGYLFTEDVIEKAAELWKLDSIQITLDGTEEVYNKTKAYVGVQDSPYRRVLKNIQLLLSHNIRVIVRLNLDMHNAEDLNDLISELNESITDKDRISVYSHVLFEDAGFTPIERNEESRAMLYSRQIELNHELGRLGLGRNHKALPFIKTHNCMADTDHATVIYPDGRFFKCEHVAIGDEYDSLFDEISDKSGAEKFKIVTELETCATCPLYPTCILLENCQGLSDKNKYTCKYDVDRTIQSLSAYYLHYKNKQAEPKPESEIVC